MKNLLLLLACFLIIHNLNAQKFSENGYLVSTEGAPNRVLVVYAQVDYENYGCVDPYEAANGVNENWRKPDPGSNDPLLNCSNPLNCAPPYWETGGGPYPIPKPLFDYNTITYNDGTLSDYYNQASLGEDYLLGDYVSISIPCTASGLGYPGGILAVKNYLDAYASQITTVNGNVLADFDLFNGYSKGINKPAGSDFNIDCLIIIWKNNGYAFGTECAGGLGVSSYGNTYSITDNGAVKMVKFKKFNN